MVSRVYAVKRDWTAVRHAVDSFESSSLAQSRSGVRWRSKAEACLSDFLYAREIEHQKGRRYPKAYAAAAGKRFGVFDLRFRIPETQSWVDVEVWGGHPGAGEAEYDRVRAAKSAFNKDNPYFLGIEHSDCYSETRLSLALESYIGIRPPSRFDNQLDHVVPSSHWSSYEEVLATCKTIAAEQPDGAFPSENWLTKQRPYESREGAAYPSLPDAIRQHFGSVSTLRSILGQGENNQTRWSKELVLSELDAWMKRYGKTPAAINTAVKCGELELSEGEVRRGLLIGTMAFKYGGGLTAALAELGYKPAPRKKSTPLTLLHKAAAEINSLGRSHPNRDEGNKIRLLVKKLYLYAGQLEGAAADQAVTEQDLESEVPCCLTKNHDDHVSLPARLRRQKLRSQSHWCGRG